ncbi:hypothetical protein [Deinococcus sp. PESE-13]
MEAPGNVTEESPFASAYTAISAGETKNWKTDGHFQMPTITRSFSAKGKRRARISLCKQ